MANSSPSRQLMSMTLGRKACAAALGLLIVGFSIPGDVYAQAQPKKTNAPRVEQSSIDFDALATPKPEFNLPVTASTSGLYSSINSEVERQGGRHNADVNTRRSQTSSASASSGTSSGSGQADTRRSSAPAAETYVCKIYCKSTSGPTIEREFRATSRREAAQVAGDSADAACNRAGHGVASAKALPESQCWKR
jgi:hypothetical protein